MRRLVAAAAALGALAAATHPGAAFAAPRAIDTFEDTTPWSAVPASGVLMKLTSEPGDRGRCLRVDFDFQKGGGYAVIHRALDLALPANYRFALRVRGATAPQNFEFKLIDSSGDNVWWKNRRDFAFPTGWQTVATRKRQIEFAWGPKGGGELDRLAAIEFAITAGSGGKGTVWLDELTFEELPPPSATPPKMVASGASRAGFEAARAVDGDVTTGWRPETAASALTLDLGVERAFGGLRIDWGLEASMFDYDLQIATTAGVFETIRAVRDVHRQRHWISLPETDARWIRLVPRPDVPQRRAELREIRLLPLEVGASLNRFFEEIARSDPRGEFSRGMLGEPQFWSVVGTPGGAEESCFSTDGAIDLGISAPSIEPALALDSLWTWANVSSRPSLVSGLPLPAVTWRGPPVELRIEAWKDLGETLHARYRVLNRGAQRRAGRLLLRLRPFQVNPPSQSLNTAGGVCDFRTLRPRWGERADTLEVDDRGRLRITPHAGDFESWPFEAYGMIPPPEARGLRGAHLAYPFALAPGESLVVDLRFEPRGAAAAGPESDPIEMWRRALGPARISLPASAADLERTLATQIGWIEVNRDGPAIQPGSRAYARSWIRDGALTCSALLRWGHREEVKNFLEWFAEHQYADGKVPCCVDARGSDPVPEHDSHGELIYLAAEYFRHTGDRATVEKVWRHVASAAAYLDTLRAQRLGPAWRDTAKREFFGILPPSISHEGYSAKPMHSYWDDFWALRGYHDAAFLARTLGHSDDARRIEASLADFRRDFTASIVATQRRHGIAYVPGCADLGDFDATSTTMALSPVQADGVASDAALRATFERYWKFFTDRRDGSEKWEAFTPYEIRNIGAFVRLGWRDRAQELIAWFLEHRSPARWAQFAEVVYNAPRTAKFVGDIPHTWVGSDFVRSILDCFAYERERDDALVLGAGVPAGWIREAPGVSAQDVSTWYGPLSMSMRSEGRAILVRIESGLRVPRGGIVIAAPGVTAGWHATVDGRVVPVSARGEVVVRALPARVRLSP